jgi:hypothetical protein
MNEAGCNRLMSKQSKPKGSLELDGIKNQSQWRCEVSSSWRWAIREGARLLVQDLLLTSYTLVPSQLIKLYVDVTKCETTMMRIASSIRTGTGTEAVTGVRCKLQEVFVLCDVLGVVAGGVCFVGGEEWTGNRHSDLGQRRKNNISSSKAYSLAIVAVSKEKIIARNMCFGTSWEAYISVRQNIWFVLQKTTRLLC